MDKVKEKEFVSSSNRYCVDLNIALRSEPASWSRCTLITVYVGTREVHVKGCKWHPYCLPKYFGFAGLRELTFSQA